MIAPCVDDVAAISEIRIPDAVPWKSWILEMVCCEPYVQSRSVVASVNVGGLRPEVRYGGR